MKNIITTVLIVLIVSVLGFFVLNNYIYNEKQQDPNTMDVKLYYYNPTLDQGEGGVQCSVNGLVAVVRRIPITETPLQDSIELLLKGDLTDAEKASGLTTEFPLESLVLESVNLTDDGVATLKFNDPQNKTVGGSCRVSILWNQIKMTAMQFDRVKDVNFTPEDLFQP